MSQPTNNSYFQYIEAGLLGAGRGVFGLGLEHPFDVVKTRRQANPQGSLVEVIKNVYKTQGFKGYYSGFIPNGVRVAGKQMYRWPMMLAFPPFFREVLPESMRKAYPTSVKVATGLAIANFEVGVICPLERLKVYLMTANHQGKGIIEFIKANQGHLSRELTRGMAVTYVRQNATWVSFLVADDKFRKMEQDRIGTKELSFDSLLKVSFLVGVVNTLANMPFDVAKTFLQKDQYMVNEGLVKTLHKIYQLHGVRGLYLGWQVRMAQYMLQSVFTVTLLEKLERSWEKKA